MHKKCFNEKLVTDVPTIQNYTIIKGNTYCRLIQHWYKYLNRKRIPILTYTHHHVLGRLKVHASSLLFYCFRYCNESIDGCQLQ